MSIEPVKSQSSQNNEFTSLKKGGSLFKAGNGKLYRLSKDEYISTSGTRSGKTIFQTSDGWFYLENIVMWCAEIQEGSVVITPEGEKCTVTYIFPNGTKEGGRSTACSNGKSYREYDLTVHTY